MAEMAVMAVLMSIGDDILREVLLRLPSQVSLVRAAAVCKAWRHVVCDPSFLRSFRSLHPPPILGLFFCERRLGVDPHFSPTSGNSPEIDVLVKHTADFSLSFLPKCHGSSWSLIDCRNGRLLLRQFSYDRWLIPEFVVADPLARSYVHLPPPRAPTRGPYVGFLGAALAADNIDNSLSGVLCVTHNGDSMETHIFSFDTSNWSLVSCDNIAIPPILYISIGMRTNGFLCWTLNLDGFRDTGHDLESSTTTFSEDTLIVLDMHRLVFRYVKRPPATEWSYFRWSFVDDGMEDGRLSIAAHDGSVLSLWTFHEQEDDDNDGAPKWVLEKEIEMREIGSLQSPSIIGARAGHVFLDDWQSNLVFALHLESMQLEQIGKMDFNTGRVYPFSMPWPPSVMS